MGGSIGLHSEPGRGSLFWVDVPLPPVQCAEKTAACEPLGLPIRALAVGFGSRVAAVLHDMCAEVGCDLATADDARQAIPMLDGGLETLLVNSQRATADWEALIEQARASGVQRVLLFAPAPYPKAMRWVADGRCDDLVLSPLLTRHLADGLRVSPIGDDLPPVEPEMTGEAHGPVPLSGRILLAEDSVANQLVATAILRRQGYSVDVANDGREAVEKFTAGGHDLILMDLRMPRMDGLEATAAIRALPGGTHIPIVAMTANVLQQDVDRCLAAGMDDFVAKPVDKARLLDVLASRLPGVPDGDAGSPGDDRQDPAAPAESAEPLIDEDVIRQLSDDVTEEAVPSMLQMFMSEASARSESLRQALADSAVERLQDEAHTLKSCAGTFGAARLQVLARDIEAACREENHLLAENLGKGMDELVRQTLAAYRDRFGFLADKRGEE